jgi:hypothetical protein
VCCCQCCAAVQRQLMQQGLGTAGQQVSCGVKPAKLSDLMCCFPPTMLLLLLLPAVATFQLGCHWQQQQPLQPLQLRQLRQLWQHQMLQQRARQSYQSQGVLAAAA